MIFVGFADFVIQVNVIKSTIEAVGARFRGRAGLAVRVLLSAGLICALVYHVGSAEIVEHLRKITWQPIAIATVILSASVLVVTPRWSVILRLLGYRIASRSLVESVFLGFFLNQLLPTAVGGDVLRAWRAKQLGADWESAIHSVLLDRATGVLISLFGAAVLLPFAGPHRGGNVLEWIVGAIAGLAILGLAALWIFSRQGNASSVTVARLRAVAARLHDSIWTFVSHPRQSAAVFGLAMLNQMLPVAAICVLASALNISLPVVDIALITFISTLAATIPISLAGWGIREGTLVYLFGLYGIPSDASFATSIVYGFALTLSAAPGALMLLRGRPGPPTMKMS